MEETLEGGRGPPRAVVPLGGKVTKLIEWKQLYKWLLQSEPENKEQTSGNTPV